MKLVSVDSLSNQEAVASSTPSFLEHGLVGMDSRLESFEGSYKLARSQQQSESGNLEAQIVHG